jgi:hypothetical protein
MCSAPSPPPPQDLPPPRALARAPKRASVRSDTTARMTARAGASRQTLMNVDGVVRRAPTASLGGNPVVLGG